MGRNQIRSKIDIMSCCEKRQREGQGGVWRMAEQKLVREGLPEREPLSRGLQEVGDWRIYGEGAFLAKGTAGAKALRQV